MNNKKEMYIRITSFFLSTVTILTMSGCNLNKNKNKHNTMVTTSTSFSESNNDISFESSDKENNSFEDDVPIKSVETSYNELIELLEENTQHFDDTIREALKQNMNIMYNNSKKVDSILSLLGFPSSTEIIKEQFVKPLKNIDFIKIKSENDFSALEKYGGSCYRPDENGIYLIGFENYSGIQQAQILAEEVIHSNQRYLTQPDDLPYPILQIFGEGEANILSWMLIYGSINNKGAFFFYDDNENLLTNVNYGLGNSDYTINTKYYMYLNVLLGNKTIEKYKKNLDSSILINKLNDLYEIDGEKFFSDMCEVAADAAFYMQNRRAEQFVNIENTFIKCMENKVDKIKNKEEVKEFFELYRYMNIQYGYEFLEYDYEGNYKEKTKNKVNKTSIETKLFNKCQEFGVLSQISCDKENQRVIFNCLINSPRNYDMNIYPINIFSSEITYNNGRLTIINDDDCSYSHIISENKVIRLNNQGDSINNIDFNLSPQIKK